MLSNALQQAYLNQSQRKQGRRNESGPNKLKKHLQRRRRSNFSTQMYIRLVKQHSLYWGGDPHLPDESLEEVEIHWLRHKFQRCWQILTQPLLPLDVQNLSINQIVKLSKKVSKSQLERARLPIASLRLERGDSWVPFITGLHELSYLLKKIIL